MQSSTDEVLVKSVIRGDDIAFSQLYERYHRHIYSTVYRIMQNPEDAQDATQEIAFKLYRSLHQWNVQKSKLSSWIYKMAVNHSIDWHRMRRRRKEFQYPKKDPIQDPVFDVPDPSIQSPLNQIVVREQIDAVLRFARILPNLHRRIFMDRYFDQCKLDEIARIENCSVGTVKSSLHRSTHGFRRFLRKSRSLPS
jgi:RNA polymerase sigma-70 factor (ECF subfamily)